MDEFQVILRSGSLFSFYLPAKLCHEKMAEYRDNHPTRTFTIVTQEGSEATFVRSAIEGVVVQTAKRGQKHDF